MSSRTNALSDAESAIFRKTILKSAKNTASCRVRRVRDVIHTGYSGTRAFLEVQHDTRLRYTSVYENGFRIILCSRYYNIMPSINIHIPRGLLNIIINYNRTTKQLSAAVGKYARRNYYTYGRFSPDL